MRSLGIQGWCQVDRTYRLPCCGIRFAFTAILAKAEVISIILWENLVIITRMVCMVCSLCCWDMILEWFNAAITAYSRISTSHWLLRYEKKVTKKNLRDFGFAFRPPILRCFGREVPRYQSVFSPEHLGPWFRPA
ncbi:hypothetical protein DFS34DRAFT_204344 [Phlyctochytrium arcticum]|nr:hypothetical protein DFS34DRAFT_204344 [Phlyctochytrium arcticum]